MCGIIGTNCQNIEDQRSSKIAIVGKNVLKVLAVIFQINKCSQQYEKKIHYKRHHENDDCNMGMRCWVGPH